MISIHTPLSRPHGGTEADSPDTTTISIPQTEYRTMRTIMLTPPQALPHSALRLFTHMTGILGMALLWLAAPALAANAPNPDAVMRSVTSTITMEKAGQERGREWENEQARLLEEIRQARLEESWYALQVETFTRYVETARSRVAEQRSVRQELERMETELEGELVRTLTAMESLVNSDMPFLSEERARRIAFLHKSLADYELASAEKLRRVLEGLQAEVSYGAGVHMEDNIIEPHGVAQGVQLIRTGRVGLYALSPDGARGWHWKRGHGFAPLDDAAVRSVATLRDMLERKQVLTLPVLPFSPSQPVMDASHGAAEPNTAGQAEEFRGAAATISAPGTDADNLLHQTTSAAQAQGEDR
ncbi:DUF3450 domain-containing protein [Desulfovibrio psychrotolerans]|uniref:DUF3450 domain-containing protein n=1 Tax=Desulfovibrio psychrotolerans TaxID=415242 RepID=A0A7J0BTE7_9BACT|nr:DUF3450 domain-containing protein [Desulfovibrio psychrotolerans]GFM36274.1 hypothetical protein DSM19430T_09580 [Desulfovibrio psychrotolerans]